MRIMMLHFMLIFLFLTNILNVSNASFTWKCSNSSETRNTSTTFVAAKSGPAGRYVVEHCRQYNKYANSSWHLQLLYLDDSSTRTEETCRVYKYNQKVTLYARFQENLMDEDFRNCTYICYSKPLDLISNGCYVIKTWLKGVHTLQSSETMHFINSEANLFSYKDKVVASIVAISSGNVSILVWYLGYIPATDYTIQLQTVHNTTDNGPEHSHDEWVDVTGNCSANGAENEVRCALRVREGCYHALLTHWAPWAQGSFFRERRSHVASFCYEREGAAAARAHAWAPWAAWAGALALAGAALGALLAWRSRVAHAWRRAVLDSWKRPRYTMAWPGTGLVPVGPGEAERCVVLLYARDCAPFMRAMASLRELVADATREPVYDLFCPWTLALSASATHAWLRAALRSAHARVLVVQAPAAARAYSRDASAAYACALGSRLVYARPHASDALLQYALSLVADTAPLDPNAYHKYYIATVCEPSEDLLEHVAAFRRYELPAASELLLEHLARPAHPASPVHPVQPAQPAHPAYTPHPGLVRQFSEALEEMSQLLRTNPRYLDDLLMRL